MDFLWRYLESLTQSVFFFGGYQVPFLYEAEVALSEPDGWDEA